ncbi:MAG: hypothetical protein WBA41_03050 [Rivularia sp. (in: cyanobacteria)]
MHLQELLKRYAAGERDFSGIDLTGADFDGFSGQKKLSGINLSNSNLSKELVILLLLLFLCREDA